MFILITQFLQCTGTYTLVFWATDTVLHTRLEVHALCVAHSAYVMSNHCCTYVLQLAMAGWLSQGTLKYEISPLIEIGLLQQLSCFKAAGNIPM